MKVLFAAIFLSTFAFAASTEKVIEAKPVGDKLAKEKIKVKGIKEEEDCDEKAKKPVEIIPESFSLGGNAGCTLPE